MARIFNRGLSDAFVEDLRFGVTAPVLDACRAAGLDVRLRDNYLTAYHHGRAVATLLWRRGQPRLSTHRKYLGGDAFPGATRKAAGDYVELAVTPDLAADFVGELPGIMATAAAHMKVEEVSESLFLTQNAGGGTFACIDRQVGVPGTGSYVDVVGVLTETVPTLVLVELKRDLDNRIQDVPAQVDRYLEIFSPGGGGLRPDVAESLERVATQLRLLAFAAPEPSLFAAGMPVLGLVVLVRYNVRSELLGRAHRQAEELSHPIWLWIAEDDGRLALPPREAWTRMG